MDFVISLAHYFYPRHSNNHKAKLLHTPSILALALVLVLYQFALNIFPTSSVKTLGYAANISTDEVIRLTNERRAQAGLSPVRYNASLSQAAAAKAQHMIQYDYWAHVAPDGTEPWKFFTNAGYRYRYAGENLARDFSSPNDAVNAWMASTSHRENLLSSKYVDIGIGVAEGDLSGSDTTIIVQLFGAPLSDTTTPQVAQAAVATKPPSPTAALTPTPTTVTETPTLEPTHAPTLAPTLAESITLAPTQDTNTLPPSQQEASKFSLLISPFQTTRGISIVITGILLMVLVIDGVVVVRRRLSRSGGRNLAHFAFFGMILAIILIAKAGEIL